MTSRSVPSDVHVLVVAYGFDDDLVMCLDALGDAFPLTVVDNASSTECQAIVARRGGRYIDPGANVGFAAGVNRGLETIARSRQHVLLLNPDARIDSSAVLSLLDALQSSPAVAAVAPAQIGEGKSHQRVAWPFPSPGRMWLEAVGLSGFVRKDGFLVGSILLLRAEAIQTIGPFDERFFLYGEEADWQRRAHDRGWELRYCPEVVARHRGGGASVDPAVRELRFHCAQETFIRKWNGSVGWQVYRAGAFVAAILRSARRDPVRRREARGRVRLYARGPCRAARATPHLS